MSVYGVKVEKQGELYVWTESMSFLDFATAENVVFTQSGKVIFDWE